MAIEQWGGALKRYPDAGDEELSVKRRRGWLLRLLPEKLRDGVIWDLGEDKLANVITERLQKRLIQSNSWRRDGQSAALVQPQAEEDEDQLDEDVMEELRALGGAGQHVRRGGHLPETRPEVWPAWR